MTQTILHRWKSIQLAEMDVTLPTGQSVVHTSILHPGAAVILPITAQREIILLKQFRPSLNQWIYELPAGTLEANESPIECAHRELIEETGYQAGQLIELGQCIPLAGFCNETQYLFVATQLSENNTLIQDDDEVIEVLKVPLSQVEQWIIDEQISDSKTIACLYKAKLAGLLD